MKTKELQKGIDIILQISGVLMGGQTNAELTISKTTIDITNKIDDEWEKNLPGTRSWEVTCDGMYIKNNKCYLLLQEAFLKNENVEAVIMMDGRKYMGSCIITNFPIKAVYNNTYKYNVRLIGDGELKILEQETTGN